MCVCACVRCVRECERVRGCVCKRVPVHACVACLRALICAGLPSVRCVRVACACVRVVCAKSTRARARPRRGFAF